MPRVIYSLWLQGEAAVPPAVRLILRRWATLNPGWALRVVDRHDIAALLGDCAIPLHQMPIQAISDVVRARLLLEGGVWTDASVLPTEPLDAWLPDLTRSSGFFAFVRPNADRAIASWFLAAAPDHVIMRKWWAAIVRFWSKPRQLVSHFVNGVPADPDWQVAPDGGGATDGFPYYWFHYLFGYLLRTEADFAAAWARCATRSALPPHELQWLLAKGTADRATLQAAVRGAPVHKLDWRQAYPLDVLAAL